jgi:hypothetical protein
MPEITFEHRVAGLRSYARSQDANVRAAVELLIWHKSWLLRADFMEACITQYSPGLTAVIRWDLAGHFSAGPALARSSSSQRAILELAVTLAEREEHWLRFRGDAHARAVAEAISRAVGIEPGAPPAAPALNLAERYDTEDARNFLRRWDEWELRPDEKLAAMPPGRAEDILAGLVRKLLAVIDHLAPGDADHG